MTELPFRIASGVLLAIQFGVRFYYLRAHRWDERIAVRHELREKLLYYLVNLSWIPMLLYVLSPMIDFANLPLPVWLRCFGGGTFLAGIVLFWWTHHVLGTNWSAMLELRKDHVLITDGPYRLVRHPMYSALFLIGIGFALLSTNSIIAVSFLGSFSLMYFIRVSDEEKMMIEQFGDAYREYMQRTGRLIPHLRL